MSKSLARVVVALQAAGVATEPLEVPSETRTAEQAAAAAGCALDQIVKSILFGGARGLYLFLTAGGNQVDIARASALAGEPLGAPMRRKCAASPVLRLAASRPWAI